MTLLEESVARPLTPPERRSLSESVAETIADGIARGVFGPGDRLIETAIATELNVSRVPVREALKILHAQGILDGGAHKGYRVVGVQSGSVHKLLEIRIALETILVRDAVANWRMNGGAGVLDDRLNAMRRAAAAGDVASVLKADLDFHRAICTAADNHLAKTLWHTIARHVLIVFGLEQRRPDELPAVVAQHEELLAFIKKLLRNRSVDQAAIRSTMENHILAVASRGKKARS